MGNHLFCNIGWMESYEGNTINDKIQGGGSYVELHKTGLEVCNFSPDVNGALYGYVEVRGKQININRLGAGTGDPSISGITVIWTARDPNGLGTVVIGWYTDAIIYRQLQTFGNKKPTCQSQNAIDNYWITAKETDSTLLPTGSRTLQVQRRKKGWMGQSNIWYADNPMADNFVKKVLDMIHKGKKTP